MTLLIALLISYQIPVRDKEVILTLSSMCRDVGLVLMPENAIGNIPESVCRHFTEILRNLVARDLLKKKKEERKRGKRREMRLEVCLINATEFPDEISSREPVRRALTGIMRRA